MIDEDDIEDILDPLPTVSSKRIEALGVMIRSYISLLRRAGAKSDELRIVLESIAGEQASSHHREKRSIE